MLDPGAQVPWLHVINFVLEGVLASTNANASHLSVASLESTISRCSAAFSALRVPARTANAVAAGIRYPNCSDCAFLLGMLWGEY